MPEERVRVYDNSPEMRAQRTEFATALHESIAETNADVAELIGGPNVASFLSCWANTPLLPGIAAIDYEIRRDMVGNSIMFLHEDPRIRLLQMWEWANDVPWLTAKDRDAKEGVYPIDQLMQSHNDIQRGSLTRLMASIGRLQDMPAGMTPNIVRQHIPFMMLHVTHAAMLLHNDRIYAAEHPDLTLEERADTVTAATKEQLQSIAAAIKQRTWQPRKSRDHLERGYNGALNILDTAYGIGSDDGFMELATSVLLPLQFPQVLKPALFGKRSIVNERTFKGGFNQFIREMAENGVILSTTAGSDYAALMRRINEYANLGIHQPRRYYEAVDGVHTSIRMNYYARRIVEELSSGRLDYADITRVWHVMMGEQPLRQRAERPRLTVEAPPEPEVDETQIVVDELVPFTILAPDEGTGHASSGEVEVRIGRTKREIDPKRVVDLVKNVAIPWGAQYCRIVARSLKERASEEPSEETGSVDNVGKVENLYYMLIMGDNLPDGTPIEHCFADHPTPKGKEDSDEHAMFLFDGRRGVDPVTGQVVLTWDPVMRTKGTAKAYGAERVLHTRGSDPYERVLNRLLSPLRPLPSPERRLGLEAILAARRPQT